jgi:hypothetical protein
VATFQRCPHKIIKTFLCGHLWKVATLTLDRRAKILIFKNTFWVSKMSNIYEVKVHIPPTEAS